MGGKALSANVAIRLTKANYERLASECVAKLRAAYPGMLRNIRKSVLHF